MWWYTCPYTFIQRKVISSLLILCQAELFAPIRHCPVNTLLICRMKCLEQEFCVLRISIEWFRNLFSFSGFHDSESTAALEHGVTDFFETLYHFIGCGVPFSIGRVRRSSIPLLFRSRTLKRPVSLQESFHVTPDFFCIRNIVHCSRLPRLVQEDGSVVTRDKDHVDSDGLPFSEW